MARGPPRPWRGAPGGMHAGRMSPIPPYLLHAHTSAVTSPGSPGRTRPAHDQYREMSDVGLGQWVPGGRGSGGLRGTGTSARGDRSTLGVERLDGELAEHDPRDPAPVEERGVTGRRLRSGEDVGCLVVVEAVVELRQQSAQLVVEAAVARAGGVAGERAAAHRRR